MLFRHRAGRPGYNLVIVYRRYPGGPIQIERWPNGERRREPLHEALGLPKPVHDEAFAVDVAEKLAAKLDRKTQKQHTRQVLGLPEPHTLDELLEAYHDKRKAKWAKGTNARHQEIMRKFWLKRLGKNVEVRDVAAMVSEIEKIAADEAEAREWSPRTEGKYLKYLRTAFNFGQKKLKWFGEEHNLSALEIPPADSQGKSYEPDETRKIFAVGPQVDLRHAVAARICYLALRRISAVRHVATQSVTREKDGISIYFGRATDKVRKSGEVVITDPDTIALIEKLMRTPGVKASGLLFPNGDLTDRARDRKPESYERFHEWMWEAEVLAKVPRIKGRGYHSFKRSAATAADEMGILGGAAQLAGTDELTLKRIYVQQSKSRKTAAGEKLSRDLRQ